MWRRSTRCWERISIYTHGDGRVIGKAAFIADFKTGAFKYTTIEPNDMTVRVFGDVAVVTGGAGMHVVNNGVPADIKIRYTDVHVRRNGVVADGGVGSDAVSSVSRLRLGLDRSADLADGSPN